MSWVDIILNIAGLLLWLNWRAGKIDPLGKRTPATLVGTLRRAEPSRAQRWTLPVFLAALIFVRAVIYWQIGPAIRWSGILNLGVISLSFRSDRFGLILLFSLLSFLVALGVLYSCLLLLSLLKGPKPIQDFVRLQLGRIDDWHPGVKLALPFVVTAIGWWAVSWALVSLRIIPQPVSPACRIEQSLIIAVQGYLIWEFPIAALLTLHLLNNYIYFGRHPVWNYADVTSNTLLWPLKHLKWLPLRIGKVDLTPIAGIAIVFFVAEFASGTLRHLYARLSF
ncbi:MAG TPA: hypothetical protein VMF08_15855 [Candidatus Sulfotelmatobacter sp.]|nr:hypothetical protein [Candidatus Sulfotelmatobacter sp.]